MDIKTFLHIAPLLPADQSVLLRGPTGVGKSAIIQQVGKSLGLEVIDVRMSIMTEGDMGGIPNFEAIKDTGVASNALYGWFIRACREPVVLFLDEINRAMVPVLQGAFQLVLDREMGNSPDGMPYKLHPGTRIFAAGNFGTEYESEDLDPAMQRRFLVWDLDPTFSDWAKWGHGQIDDIIIDFLRAFPAHFRVDPAQVEPGTICPNPAVWERVSRCLTHANMAPTQWAGSTAPMGAYAISVGLVGPEASIALMDYIKNVDRQITAEDVLKRWGKVKKDVVNMPTSKRFALIDMLAEWLTHNTLTPAMARKFGNFADVLEGEELVHAWTSTVACRNCDNVTLIHAQIGSRVRTEVAASHSMTPS